MEAEQERRNVGEIERDGGQPSRNSGQTGLEPEEHRIDIVEISPRVENWIKSLKNEEESTQSQSTRWPRIPKVPQMLRGTQDFEKFYEPSVISIGPYHHGKPHLHPGEMIKLLCNQKFLNESHIRALYRKIESNIEAVKKCYDWSSRNEYDNEELAWMMLMDGCFLLQFIRRKEDDSKVDMSNVLRNHQINFVEQDLFLLENQLPFGVLKLIFDEEAKFHGVSTMEETIEKFFTPNNGRQLEPEDKEPSHLLDLLRSALLGRFKMIRGSQPEQEQEAEKKGEPSSSSGGGNGGSQPDQDQEAEKKGESSSSSGGGNGGSQPEQEQEAEKKGEESSSRSRGGNGGSQPEQEQEPKKRVVWSSSQGGKGGLCCPWKKGKQRGNGGSQPEQEEEAEKKGESSSSFGGGNGGSQPEQGQEADERLESEASEGADFSSQPPQGQQAKKNGKSLSSGGGDGGFCCPRKNSKQRGIWQSFRHIKELKAAGIYLKPSRTSFLRDISFKSYFFCGHLKLPPITLDDFTKTKFLNMTMSRS
ncbi:uncharacterized protein LOC117930993 [Vitis riparia]|uniref:uncharacterized protein LOC117930993 n=1 Tax=Vitis riparia TaxID=96939 RepID=UPI00155A0690|nr:uncharacterized protein LOC117930993 [Vitis riparia]